MGSSLGIESKQEEDGEVNL